MLFFFFGSTPLPSHSLLPLVSPISVSPQEKKKIRWFLESERVLCLRERGRERVLFLESGRERRVVRASVLAGGRVLCESGKVGEWLSEGFGVSREWNCGTEREGSDFVELEGVVRIGERGLELGGFIVEMKESQERSAYLSDNLFFYARGDRFSYPFSGLRYTEFSLSFSLFPSASSLSVFDLGFCSFFLSVSRRHREQGGESRVEGLGVGLSILAELGAPRPKKGGSQLHSLDLWVPSAKENGRPISYQDLNCQHQYPHFNIQM